MIWYKKTLGEIYAIEGGSVQTGPFGSQLHESDYKEFGVPVIMPKDIKNDKLDLTNIAHISDEDAKRLSQHIVKVGDIICPRRGEIGKRIIIEEGNVGAFCGTGCIRLRGTGLELNQLFFFYFLQQPNVVNWIENQAVGSTMMNLNTSIIKSIPVKYPPLPIQQKIASILSAYDELIENNKQRIKLLEEVAEEIYKEWFVRLRFPNYENTEFVDGLPLEWENMRLDKVLETVKRKPKISSDQYLSEGKFPIIDQGDKFIAGYTDNESIVQFDPLPLLIFGDHTRRIKFVNYPFVSGADGTQLLSPKNKKLLPIYFYISIKSIDLSNFHYARHFKFLKQEYILIPDNNTLDLFNNLTVTFFDEIQILTEKNQLLQQTRDLLLPRLISGKLSVAGLLEHKMYKIGEDEESLSMAAEDAV